MRDDFFEGERNIRKFGLFSGEKKEKKYYKISYVSKEKDNLTTQVIEFPGYVYVGKKDSGKGFLYETGEGNASENTKLKERIENLLKENEELNKKAESLNAELQEKNGEILENQKKIEALENKVKEQEKRIEEYIDARNLPQAITEDVNSINQKFIEAREMILSLKDKVNYGDKGLKKLCYLYSVCYSIGNDEMKGLAEQLKYILEDDFNCRMIKPEQNEIFDSHYHEATVYDEKCPFVDKCLTPGWKYNDKALVKAVVKIKSSMGENENEC